MPQPKLSDAEISGELAEVPLWTREGNEIRRTAKAPAFLTGVDLVRQVAQRAEEMNHHPDIDIRWRSVTFALSTHDSGGLTALDFALAKRIDALAAELDCA